MGRGAHGATVGQHQGPVRLRRDAEGRRDALQPHQRSPARLCQEDQHAENFIQTERKYRDVPEGLRHLRSEGAGSVPGQRSVRD